MSSRITRSRRAASKPSTTEIPPPCECNSCNDCRDRIIVASLDQLSKYQDEILEEVRDKFNALERQMKLMFSRFDEITKVVEQFVDSGATKSDIEDVKSMFTCIKTGIHNLRENSTQNQGLDESTLKEVIHAELLPLRRKIDLMNLKVNDPTIHIGSRQPEPAPISSSATQTDECSDVVDDTVESREIHLIVSPPVTPHSADGVTAEVAAFGNVYSAKNESRLPHKDEWDWIHISNVPTFVRESDVCRYVSKRFGLRNVLCKILLKKSSRPEDLLALSFKVGVKSKYGKELLNRRRWPPDTRVRRFRQLIFGSCH